MLAYYFRAPKPAEHLIWPSIGWTDVDWLVEAANTLGVFLFWHPRIRYDRILIPLYGGVGGAPGNLKIAIYDPTDGSQLHYEQIAHTLTPGAYEMHESLMSGPQERGPGWLAIMAKADQAISHANGGTGANVMSLIREDAQNFDWSGATIQVAVGAGGKEAVGWFAGKRADGDMTMPATLPDWSQFTEQRRSEWLVYFVDGQAWETVRDLT